MRPIVFVFVAVITLAGAVTYMVPATGQSNAGKGSVRFRTARSLLGSLGVTYRRKRTTMSLATPNLS